MIRAPIHLSIFILIALFLAACGSRPTPLPSAIVLTDAPTRTAFPTTTATPSPGLFTAIHSQVTYVPTRTPTPTKTHTLTPTTTPTFVPTLPPATVATGSEGYRLRDWRFQDAQLAISEAEGKIANYTFDSPGSYTISDFTGYLTVLEREVLQRFPNDTLKAGVHWKLSNNEASYDSPLRSVKHFLQAVETELNSGLSTLDTLSQTLRYYGFTVLGIYPATNIFGDGQSAIVFNITAGRYEEGSIILIITGSQPGHYRTYSLYPDWQILYWYDLATILVTDLNGNGQPDIQRIYTWYGIGFGAGYCGSQFSLYEWQGHFPEGEFVDVAQNIRPVSIDNDGECNNELWEIGLPQENGTQPVISVVNRYAGYETTSSCTNYELRTKYIWNGLTYQRDSETANTPNPTDPAWCGILWADWAGGLNNQAVSLLSDALSNWPIEVDEIWGPSAQDYFRFKLGTWYALRGEKDLAQSTLQSVRDHPNNPQFTVASEMARVYLMDYQSHHDSLTGCRAALQAFYNTRAQFPPDAPYGGGPKNMLDAWGFLAPYWHWGNEAGSNICDLKDALRQSIRNFRPKSTTELLDWFNQRQIAVGTVVQADLNDDGVQDWVGLVRESSLECCWMIWALIRDDVGLNALLVKDLYQPTNGFFAKLDQSKLDLAYPPLNIFTLNDYQAAFQIFKLPNSPEIVLNLIFSHGVITVPAPAPDELQIAEQTLLETSDLPKALELLQSQLAKSLTEPDDDRNHLPRIRPRLLYLLGLAHELSGHEREAVQAYWQLWHDYPDSPYTLMARRKLEVIEP